MGFPVIRLPDTTSLWVEPVTSRFSPSPKDGMGGTPVVLRSPERRSPLLLEPFTTLTSGFTSHSFSQVTDCFLGHEKDRNPVLLRQVEGLDRLVVHLLHGQGERAMTLVIPCEPHLACM